MGKYSELIRRATSSVDYWTQVAIRSFVLDLTERMASKDISKAELARKIGTSPAYVSKVIRGDANFTLETMTKLAMAVGGKLRTEIVDADVHPMRIESGSAAWTIVASSRQRAAVANVIVAGPMNEASAANDWKFNRMPQLMSTIDSEEMQAA